MLIEYCLLWDDFCLFFEFVFVFYKDVRKEYGLMSFLNNGFIFLKKCKENICLGISFWYLYIFICCLVILSC